MQVNNVQGAAAIKSALELSNQFPLSTALDANSTGNVRTSE
jgi:hypothetical protein